MLQEPKAKLVKGRFFIWLMAIPIWLVLTLISHEKLDLFIRQHFWLVIFGPLVVVFLIVFIRNYYLQYKQ